MSAVTGARTLRIGEVAERTGVTTRTIRYYEELGLLPSSAERVKGTHRHYTEADVQRLSELVRLRDLLGLTLEELVELAEAEEARAAIRSRLADDPGKAEQLQLVERAFPLVQRQLELVRARRAKLDEFSAELEEKLRRLEQRRKELTS